MLLFVKPLQSLAELKTQQCQEGLSVQGGVFSYCGCVLVRGVLDGCLVCGVMGLRIPGWPFPVLQSRRSNQRAAGAEKYFLII